MIHKKRKVIRWLLLAALLLLLLPPGILLFRGFMPANRIDVRRLTHRDHTIYQGPKRDDGSIDYLARLDEIYSQGVTNDNNFLVTILETCPKGSPEVFAKSNIRHYRSFLTFDMDANPRLVAITHLAEHNTFLDKDVYIDLDSNGLQCLEWKKTESKEAIIEELVEDWKQQEPALTKLLVELRTRKRLYSRLQAEDSTGIDVPYGHVHLPRSFCRILRLRAELAGRSGDYQRCMESIEGIYQITDRLSQGPILLDQRVALSSYGNLFEPMQCLLNSDARNTAVLRRMEPITDVSVFLERLGDRIDIGHRATSRHLIDSAIRNGKMRSPFGKQRREEFASAPMARGLLDCNLLAELDDQRVDTFLIHLKSSSHPLLPLSAERLKPVQSDWRTFLVSPGKESTRIADLFLQDLAGTSHDGRLIQRLLTHSRLLRIGIELRRWEQEHHQLPTLAELLETDKVESITDPFSNKPFIVVRNKNDLLVYSVGVDLQDDSGNPINYRDIVLKLTLAPAIQPATRTRNLPNN